MKTFVRILAVLAISLALGLALYTIVQPIAPAVSLVQGGPGGQGGAGYQAGPRGPGGEGGSRGGAGHPQVGVLGQLGPVLLKFAAAFVAVACARALVARRKPRDEMRASAE